MPILCLLLCSLVVNTTIAISTGVLRGTSPAEALVIPVSPVIPILKFQPSQMNYTVGHEARWLHSSSNGWASSLPLGALFMALWYINTWAVQATQPSRRQGKQRNVGTPTQSQASRTTGHKDARRSALGAQCQGCVQSCTHPRCALLLAGPQDAEVPPHSVCSSPATGKCGSDAAAVCGLWMRSFTPQFSQSRDDLFPACHRRSPLWLSA